MWSPGIGLVLGVTLLFVGLSALFVLAVDIFRRYRGVKRVHCPETGGWVEVCLDTRHALLTALGGRPALRVTRCTRWPERRACDQDCLRKPENQLTLHTLTLVGVLVLLAPAVVMGATVTGKVTFEGTPPPPTVLQVTKDTDKCGPEQTAEDLVVGADKGVQYAVVSVINAPPGQPAAPSGRVELDQQKCRFTPRIVLLPAGMELVVRNSDGIAHNLHTFSKTNPAMNKAQPGFMKTMSIRTITKPEIIRVQCDMHNWMRAWIVVVDNPYTAITDAAGRFTLPDLPAGTYTLKFWHETLGAKQQEVTVQDGATATVDVVMGLP